MKKIVDFIFQLPIKSRVKIWFIGVLFTLSLMTSIVLGYNAARFLLNTPVPTGFSVEDSAQSVKKIPGVPKRILKRELRLYSVTPNDLPTYKKGVSHKKPSFFAKRAAQHFCAKDLKISLFFTLAFFGLVVLVYISEWNKSRERGYAKKSVRWFYIPSLLFSVLVVGFLLGKSPNPMESAVKGIKMLGGFGVGPFNVAAILILFIIASIVGNKIICGWACPFGALQELIFTFSKKIKKYTPPFWLTNSIRVAVFLFALTVLFGVVGDSKGFMVYHSINPFNIFALNFKSWLVLSSVIFFLVSGLFFYRPFCQFICPFGLVTWFLEKISIFKIRVDHEKCIKCQKCFKICPTGAIKGKVMENKIPKECFSCGRCLDQCPTKAIDYN